MLTDYTTIEKGGLFYPVAVKALPEEVVPMGARSW
jgi:hypothetical protein